MIVDPHHHLHDITNNYYPWLCDGVVPADIFGDSPEKLRTDYLIGDYLADIKDVGVAKSVHVQNGWDPKDPAGETKWVQAIADTHGFPHAIVAYAELQSDSLGRLLDEHSRYANLRGIRQILNWHQDPALRFIQDPDLMNRPAWRSGFAEMSSRGLSFDLQIYHHQAADAMKLAGDFPNTAIVLNHGGMPLDRSVDGLKAWRVSMRDLARASNVYVKLSGLALGQKTLIEADIRPLVLTLIEIFGVDRAMFASNFPVDNLFSDYKTLYSAFKNIISGFSDSEREKLFSENAESFYRI